MQFLFPYFLFALVAIAIPVIIHFFNFRRFKTVYFSNVDFLKNIKKESQKRSRLKQLLILIARIMAIASLVLAFSQPYIPLNNRGHNNPNQVVAVYIDNSFSMNSKSGQGQLLEIARTKAVEIAKEYKPGTDFILITNDFLPKHQHLFNREQFIQQVSEIKATPNVIPLSRVYNRLKESVNTMDGDAEKSSYFLTDFQRNITDIANFNADTSIWSYFIPLTPKVANNLYIDSCWFETPSRKLNEEETLFVKIINLSDEDYQGLPLKFYLNDSLKALANFSISAQGEVEASLKYTNFKSGFQFGRVELTDYPVTHDNTFYISYHLLPEVKALAIYDGPEGNEGLGYLKALFKDDAYIHLDAMNSKNVRISQLHDYNTIFLLNIKDPGSGIINELGKAAANGASILFFPNLEGNIESYNRLLAKFNTNKITGIDTTGQAIGGIAYENHIYSDAFRKKESDTSLPEINGHFRFTSAIRIAETKLLWFKNSDKALGSIAYKDGFLYTFSFPLNQQNAGFATDILFVPTIYGLVLNSIPRQKISYTIGTDHFVLLSQFNLTNKNYPVVIQDLKSDAEFKIETQVSDANKIRLDLSNIITHAGQYAVKSDNKVIAPLSFNYNRDESDLRYFTFNEIQNELASAGLTSTTLIKNTGARFSEIFSELQNGRQLWKWFVLFALIFIAAEALIIRFWKN